MTLTAMRHLKVRYGIDRMVEPRDADILRRALADNSSLAQDITRKTISLTEAFLAHRHGDARHAADKLGALLVRYRTALGD
jgi:hypothetical protein